MNQQRLARHEIERLLGERQRPGDALYIATTTGQPNLHGQLTRVLHPPRLALNADQPRIRQHREERSAPVPETRTDVKD